MSEGKKPTSRPPTHPGDVPPSHIGGQANITEQTITTNQNCQAPLSRGGIALSPDDADGVFHALLGDSIRFLAAREVGQVVADKILSASRMQLLAAAKKRRLHSNEAAMEFLTEALASRVAGLQVLPNAIARVAARSKAYSRRFASGAGAEDYLQAALLLVHQNPGQFGAFTFGQALGVLRGITRNMQRKEFRSQRRLILTEGEEVAELTPSAASTSVSSYAEAKQVAARLEREAPKEVRIATEFLDRKIAGEDLSRTVIERASRARKVVAKKLRSYGVETRHVYRERAPRYMSSLVEVGYGSIQPSNDNALPESSPVAVSDSAGMLEEQSTPPSRARRRS